MSIETLLKQFSDSISASATTQRTQMSKMTAVGEVNHSFGFIQGIEAALNLAKQLAQPLLTCLGQGTAATAVGGAVDTLEAVVDEASAVASSVTNIISPPAQEPVTAAPETPEPGATA